MHRRWLPVVLLVLVALTAGCAGLFGDGSRSTTLTPVPEVETPAPGVPAPDQPGSVQLSVETDRLRAANRQARAATTYTLERTVVVRSPNGTMRIERERLEGTGDRALEYLAINGSGRLSSVVENGTLWTNGTTTWTRTRLSNGRTVTNRLLGSDPDPYGFGSDLVDHVLQAARFEVTTREGTSGAVLRSRTPFSLNLPLVPLATGPPANASARLVVDGSGFVRAVDLSYETTFGDETLTVTISHRITRRNETVVDRPVWVPTNRSDS
jgi:hypothetical protein